MEDNQVVFHHHYYTVGFKGLIALAIVTSAAVKIAAIVIAAKS